MRLLFSLLLLVLGVMGVDIPILLDGALVEFPTSQVAGNIVNGVALAAQVIVSEFALEVNQGYIEQISFDGSIKILNGPTIRINDPNAVFSAGFSLPFMVSDDVNPSITSFSGFPMCVPRSVSDVLCPDSNRPRAPGTGAPSRIFQAPDALFMAPFLVGDYIEYHGFRASTGNMVVFEIVAWNVQITTTGSPTYIRIEEALIGVFDSDPNVEVAETRFVGYTSDPTTVISLSAIDIDPCTGAESFRNFGVPQLRPEAGGRNKWIARFDGTVATAYTREYRAIASTGTVVTRNGIVAGQYVVPILDWIQPELLVPGSEPPINEYSQFSQLTRGVGPDEDGNMFGPLDPFPQSGVAVFDLSTCPPPGNPADPQSPTPRVQATIPISLTGTTATVADKPLYVRADDTFTLRGFQDNPSTVFANDTLVWSWSVVAAGSAGSQTNLATFTPSADTKSVAVRFATSAPTGDYIFQLSIRSVGQNRTGTATFTVKLFSGPDTVAVTAVTWTSSQSGTIGVSCSSNYLVDYRIAMTVTYPADGGTTTTPMAATPPGSGSWAFSSRRVNRPGTVVCRSLLGGQATANGLTAKKRSDEKELPARVLRSRVAAARR
ncbi:hypothetical protein B0T26DRAFT_744154 [Lasiosphaeria miniovina]|uniref:PKD/Chitinase domain-containing protein n=1 Tax=Lasiosphaeria miniovina TaxID=1954250 RepID=A0AA39ZSV1_9PEZI|nr:uncharacterized protein B0T26DRAFT_744154 [Lasiosphaeria miniovina]KAK0702992.1 hypothetical protein B0T26DRAFT_744154 [Lasiosphaeria miniovina]